MAIYRVVERYDDCTLNNQWQRTYTRRFLAFSDDRDNDGPLVARQAPGIPQLANVYDKSPYEKDLGSYVNNIKASRKAYTIKGGVKGSIFDVEVSYGPFDPSRYPENPLEHPYKVSIGYQQFDKVLWFDLDGKAILNSAGCRFGDPVTVENAYSMLSITRNEPSFDPSLAKALNNRRNSSSFLGADPRTVKMLSPTGEQFLNADIGIYWAVGYVFLFSDTEWTKQILDQGYSEIIDGILTQMTQKGQPLQDAVPLDGSGSRLAEGADPVSLEFNVYLDYDFNSFAFDPYKLGLSGG